MYNKAIVFEINEAYAIVLDDNGNFLKVRKKNDMKVGQKIFVLSEDIINCTDESKEKSITKTSKAKIKRKYMKWLYTAAATIVVITVLATTILRTSTAKADSMVYIEGSYGMEIKVDRHDRIKSIRYSNISKDTDNNTDNDTDMDTNKDTESGDNSNQDKWVGKNIDDVLPDIIREIDESQGEEVLDIKYSVSGHKEKRYEKKIKKSIDDYKDKVKKDRMQHDPMKNPPPPDSRDGEQEKYD